MVTESPYLFVYGTLRSGAATPWAGFLSENATLNGSGRVRGLVFQLNGYAGMIPSSNDADCVLGEVVCLSDPASALQLLDDYEGCGTADPAPHEFERRIINVLMDDGRSLNAWAYVYCWDISKGIPVRSGDFLRPHSAA